jgi:type I restriction enzyme R subunit
VLPNPAALEYRGAYSTLAFIRASVANLTRDPRYSMADASAKVRAIIEEYLRVNGVGVEVPPVDIFSPGFIDGAGRPQKSDRAAADEMEYAIKEYIKDNAAKDPELFEQFSERLKKILNEFEGNPKMRRAALAEFIKKDLRNARKNERTYGYDAEREMPFFALLRKELFGERAFGDLSKGEFDALKEFTDYCLSRLKAETAKIDFWRHDTQIHEMRAGIRSRLIDFDINADLNGIVQKIVELGRVHFK